MVAELKRTEQMVEKGKIARLIYFAQDTGYAIAEIEREDLSAFTAVGTGPDFQKGMEVDLQGEWKTHPKFGKQFVFIAYQVPRPSTDAGIISFLATLRGLGEGKAKAVFKMFGEDVLRILEEDGRRLLEVSGIGPKTLANILESFEKSKGLQKIISFLGEIGVNPSCANRLYRAYGIEAIARIQANPYILAEEVRGFGFSRADEVALKMGILPNSEFRAIAAILHTLKTAASLNGHCFLSKNQLITEACSILAMPDYRPQISDLESVVQDLSSGQQKQVVVEGDRVYLRSYYEAEVGVSKSVRAIAGQFSPMPGLEEWIDGYENRNGIELSKGQRAAITAANSNGFVVVTGGAGVGKSTVCKAVIESWYRQNKRVVAAAPTGKAAQRIREATGLMSASTIHRLLGWNGTGFNHNEDNPLAGDAFLIDEFSMTDIRLANSLFAAIPRHATVLIVGDVNQLPSVGAGSVLGDLIQSGSLPVIRLTEIFRQAAESNIIQTSLAINEGRFPPLEQLIPGQQHKTDALWIRCEKEAIAQKISWLISRYLPDLGWQPDDIQILSPMHKGEAGNFALNDLAKRIWNRSWDSKTFEAGGFRIGDRVMQTKNNYDKKVFNGDIGKIHGVDTAEKEVSIWFPDLDNPDGRVVPYDYSDLDDLVLAYAVSIHKSQGSEFPVVIIPATMSHYMMLARNLYYTGVTRGKKLVILVGEDKAIGQAVRTQKLSQRNTGLTERLAR